MSNGLVESLLLEVDHIKYRKAGEGRSPIGRLFIYSEHVEWRDNGSSEVLQIKFIQIKGQRISPPNKPKVQLQICLQNEDQATFVFLNPAKTRDELVQERELLKETLQQSLVAHRARVNQMAASNEKDSKANEIQAKQRLLLENKQLEQLYQHLVISKLIQPQDFWADYYKSSGVTEESPGISGAFLANIAQQEGTHGVKLNLNAEIIQAIFNTYPAVERKHLELVPHEMTEQQFWSKFFQSHYYHREREVLPNPSDPFADCVRMDDAEMEKLLSQANLRKRFDLDGMDDNSCRDFLYKSESARQAQKTTLVRRCNYLSERIVNCLKPSASSDVSGENGASNGKSEPNGFAILNRIINEEEGRLESSELKESEESQEMQTVRLGVETAVAAKTYPAEEASSYKRVVLDFLDEFNDEDVLSPEDNWFLDNSVPNGLSGNGLAVKKEELNGATDSDWGLSPSEMVEVRSIHDAVAELAKHFWTCFPPVTPELEAKLDRMEDTLRIFETSQLQDAANRFGRENVQHCFDMIEKAHARYAVFDAKRKK